DPLTPAAAAVHWLRSGFLVPTLRVGTHGRTLRVPNPPRHDGTRRGAVRDAERRRVRTHAERGYEEPLAVPWRNHRAALTNRPLPAVRAPRPHARAGRRRRPAGRHRSSLVPRRAVLLDLPAAVRHPGRPVRARH